MTFIRKHDIQILLKLLKFLSRYPWHMALAFLSLVLSSLFSLAVPRIMGQAIDACVAKGEPRFLLLSALAVIGAGLLRGGFTYLQSFFGEYVSSCIAYDMRNALYDHIQHLSFDFHDRANTGQLMSRATADVEAVRWFISFGILRAARVVILFVAISFMLFSLNHRLTLASFACLPIIALWAIASSSRTRAVWAEVQENLAEMGTVLQENLTGVRVVKAFHRGEHETEKFARRARQVYDGSVWADRLYAMNNPSMSFVFILATGLILWWGGQDVIAGKLTAGELTQIILYLLMIAQPVRMLGYIGGVTARAISAGERILEVLETEPTIKDSPHGVELPRAQGNIRFENVSFAYGSELPVLKDVNFLAKPGQVVALVGATGSGKTTIVSLIPRFYDVTSGRITIDGKDIRELKLASLRRNLGIVQQDVFLFSAPIHDNIAYGVPDASRSAVIEAAKAAQLHDFIISLPQGYDTWVGERGITLSGGQRQRLAIARTLLTDPPILVLDDATSSVDTETEYLIQQALTTLMEGRTTIVIAQRLSTVKRADLILVIEDGYVAEQGRHEELLAKGGYYREIYDLQLRDQEAAQELARYRGDSG